MTWYANEILIPASDAVISKIAADPRLAPYSYWVKNLDEYPWYHSEHKHDFPPLGIIVIRPVLQTTDEDHHWYDESILDWSTLNRDIQCTGCINNSIDKDLDAYLNSNEIVPIAFRQFLADLAMELNTSVLYYAGFMWGGDVESEYCLVYSPQEQLFLTKTQIEGSDALREGLAAIGIQLPTGFFALHTRSFSWHEHHISSQTYPINPWDAQQAGFAPFGRRP
jgi:hypothetical protein